MMNSEPLTQRLTSLPALGVTALASFLIYDLIGVFSLILCVEAILFAQLILAWSLHERRRDGLLLVGAVLAMLACFRVAYISTEAAWWAFRSRETDPLPVMLVWRFGILALHPRAMDRFRRLVMTRIPQDRAWRIGLTLATLALLAVLFTALHSIHIARDGADWILRARQPDTWHNYLREPLAVGLYRGAYLLVNSFAYVNSYRVIAGISILAGVWSAFWYIRWTREIGLDDWRRTLAYLLAAAASGWALMGFAHIDVYPALMLGTLPLMYYTQRYWNGSISLAIPALWLSFAFALHLSVGWLFPAFALLPFLRKGVRAGLRDAILFAAAFVGSQALFWGALIVFRFDASLALFVERLHEQFHVGPERLSFVPMERWLLAPRLHHLANVYLYLGVALIPLVPLALLRMMKRPSRETLFWLIAAGSYFIYSFTWNADRSFPEDWDLFAPMIPPAVFWITSVLLKGSGQRTVDGGRNDESEWDLVAVYLVAAGTLPFVFSQIWYHHTTPFLLQRMF